MNLDCRQIEGCIQNHIDPEPFSGIVHLTKGDEVLFEQACGLAIRPESIPNRANTRFQTASGCKIFTAIAICKLVETGRLAFDTPLRDCIDVDFPNYAPGITIHHLLTHSSGITSYFEEDVDPDYETLWKDFPMYKVRRPKDFLPLFKSKCMKFEPGERFDYNDGGYILLGIVIEHLSGTSFDSYIKTNIFEPAQMAASGYFATDRLPPHTAYAYIDDEDGTWRTNFFAVPIIGAPDGGAYTTAPDMARFWKAVIANRLLGREMTRLMLKPQIATSQKPPHDHYGYGVWIDTAGGGVRKFFVEGSDPGVALRSALYPAEDVVLTLIGNTGRALWRLYRKIEEALAV
jgi:CubicO group peptidase (beta-lactamase class C family)